MNQVTQSLPDGAPSTTTHRPALEPLPCSTQPGAHGAQLAGSATASWELPNAAGGEAGLPGTSGSRCTRCRGSTSLPPAGVRGVKVRCSPGTFHREFPPKAMAAALNKESEGTRVGRFSDTRSAKRFRGIFHLPPTCLALVT